MLGTLEQSISSQYIPDELRASVALQPSSDGLGDNLLSFRNLPRSSSSFITASNTIGGTLDSTDSNNPTRRGSFRDDYLLTGVTAGQVVQLNLSSTVFDTYLQVVNAATGQVLAFNDDANFSTLNSQVTFTAEAGISYIVRTTSYASNANGAYSLTSNIGTLTAGTPINLSQVNQNLSGSLVTTDAANSQRPGTYYDGYLLTNLTVGQQVQVSLNSSSFDPYLEVVNVANGVANEVLVASNDNFNGLNSVVSFTAQAGATYMVRVTSSTAGGTGAYSLVTTTPATSNSIDLGNTLSTAEIQSSAIFTRSQQVSASDRDDFFSFSVAQSGIFTANLTGLTGDADVRLIRDANNNGTIDQGEVLAWQWERGTGNESIRRFLDTGTYFLQVTSYNNQTANYNVATNFTAAATDDRRFSIQVNFGLGTESLNQTLRNAVVEAARTWENVISYSSFNGSQTLTINITGEDLGAGILAGATWNNGNYDNNGNFIPTSGYAIINTNSQIVNTLTSSAGFFRQVMTHEFGHVLGIGSLWETETVTDGVSNFAAGRNLVNRSTGTYNANSYAGWAYGELLGTYTQTAVPLTTGAGEGSDYSHWREQVFDTELMTHQAEAVGTNMPLSQLTIASLRDLGYNVNYGASEPYSLPTASTSPTTGSSTIASSSLNSSFNVRCGCGAHLAAGGLTSNGSTSLAAVIGVA